MAELESQVRELARPLRTPADLDPLLERIGGAQVVLLGEASHGTHEYYAWRAVLTSRLVAERGFSFVGVEGDWPDCYRVNCSVRLASSGSAEDPREVLRGYERWPTWMWANEEVADFTRGLRAHNAGVPSRDRVGFYGLDVYSLWDSLRSILGYLREHEPEHVGTALTAFRCFEPYAEDPQAYARATRLVPTSCERAVVEMLADLGERLAGDVEVDRDAAFNAEQNARVAAGAEAYYRAMVRGGPDSWNVRDHHMADTLDRLLAHHSDGRPARAVVWEHNTHVGDARFTDMRDAGMVNLGQLARERYGEDDVVIVGFGSHHGTVLAADEWGEPVQRMPLPPARAGSLEAVLHDAVPEATALFVFPPELPAWLAEERPHRAVGVVYHPGVERWGNYVPTVLGRRYDAFCWFDESRALLPLPGVADADAGSRQELETFPNAE